MTQPQPLLTLAEVADRLRIEGAARERSVRRLIRQGRLRAHRLHERGNYLVSEEHLAAYLRSCETVGLLDSRPHLRRRRA